MNADVVVVGAGICGLTTALALVKQGYSVCVVEKRKDHRTQKAKTDLDRAARALRKANKHIGSAKRASKALATVGAIRRKYWGQKERNVLIDEHTLETLAALGVDLGALPQLESMTIEGIDNTLTLCVSPTGERFVQTSREVDVDEALFRRTFSAQPTLGELERRIMAALGEHTNARTLFNRRAVKVEEDDTGARVLLGNGRCISTRYVIIADGGAASSLTNGAATSKCAISKEPMNVGVFVAECGVRFLHYDVAHPFTYTSLTSDGWIAAFCDGRRVTVATNIPRHESDESYWASAFLRFIATLGLCAPLAEAPFQTMGETAIAERFTVGSRVLIAGDAAMTGNPRFGLGVRFCMLWAVKVSELFADVTRGTRLDVAGFERFGRMIVERRMEFERAWTETIDNLTFNDWDLSNPGFSRFLQEALRAFELSVVSSRGGANVQFILGLAFDNQGAPTPSSTLHRVLRSYSVVSIISNVFVELRTGGSGFAIGASLSESNKISVQLGTKLWTIVEGDLQMSRLADAWEVILKGARARLSDDVETEGPTLRANSLTAPLGHYRWVVPDRLIDELSGLVPVEFGADRLADHRLLNIEFELSDGEQARWGPLHVRAAGRCRLRLKAMRQRKGNVRLVLDVVSGRVIPLDFTAVVKRGGLQAGRWLTELSKFTEGSIDAFVDRWAEIAGATVRRIYVDPLLNGGAIATMQSVVPISIHLAPNEVVRLRQEFFSSSMLAKTCQAFWPESNAEGTGILK